MDLHKSDSEEINENGGNTYSLHTLVTTIKTLSRQRPIFLEVYFLNKFSKNKLIPLKSFNPRWIIDRMIEIHAKCTKVILKNPNYLTKLVYKYNSNGKKEEFVFSNNMPFYVDIMTICFLYIAKIIKFEDLKPVNDLMTIMRTKYYIFNTDSFGTQIITINKIILSYPSVITDLLCFNNVSPSIFNILLQWNLTKIFCLPWLALIIPVLRFEFKIPLTLLLAMAVALDSENKPSYVLYQRILALYTSEVFSRNFKLKMCIKWGIIYKKGREYKFAHYFTRLREKAVDLILSIKVNDPSVGYTLSQIDEM